MTTCHKSRNDIVVVTAFLDLVVLSRSTMISYMIKHLFYHRKRHLYDCITQKDLIENMQIIILCSYLSNIYVGWNLLRHKLKIKIIEGITEKLWQNKACITYWQNAVYAWMRRVISAQAACSHPLSFRLSTSTLRSMALPKHRGVSHLYKTETLTKVNSLAEPAGLRQTKKRYGTGNWSGCNSYR